SHLPQLDLLQQAIEVLALIVQPAANLLDPLIRLIIVPLAVVAQSRYLIRSVRLLPRAGDPRIHNGLSPSFRRQSTVSKVLVMRVVAPVSRAAMGLQDALAVPLLERVDRPPDQPPKLLGRICGIHTYVLPHMPMFLQAITPLLSLGPGATLWDDVITASPFGVPPHDSVEITAGTPIVEQHVSQYVTHASALV